MLGEELGLLGTLIVLALFVTFAIRAFLLALRTTDRFGFFLIVGCALLIVIQAFINIGVVTSSWPVTGVPLPFISFGGTSLIVSLIAVALIMNVARRSRMSAGARRVCRGRHRRDTSIPRSRSTMRSGRVRSGKTTSRGFSATATDSKRRSLPTMPLTFVPSAALQRQLSLRTLFTVWRNLFGVSPSRWLRCARSGR